MENTDFPLKISYSNASFSMGNASFFEKNKIVTKILNVDDFDEVSALDQETEISFLDADENYIKQKAQIIKIDKTSGCIFLKISGNA